MKALLQLNLDIGGLALRFLSVLFMLLIVYLGTLGALELYPNSPSFGFFGSSVSILGVLFLVLELSVMGVVSGVFSEIRTASKKTIVATILIIIAFSMLCFTSMAALFIKAHNGQYEATEQVNAEITAKETTLSNYEQQLIALAAQQDRQTAALEAVARNVEAARQDLSKNAKDKSDRRTKYANCAASVDCSGAIDDLTIAGAIIESELKAANVKQENLAASVDSINEEVFNVESDTRVIKAELVSLEQSISGETKNQNEKVQTVAVAVDGVRGIFGLDKSDEPVKVASYALASIIYLLYMFVNLRIGLKSEHNIEAKRIKPKSTEPKAEKKKKVERIFIPVPKDLDDAQAQAYVTQKIEEHNYAQS